jgi:hypothetical protein
MEILIAIVSSSDSDSLEEVYRYKETSQSSTDQPTTNLQETQV